LHSTSFHIIQNGVQQKPCIPLCFMVILTIEHNLEVLFINRNKSGEKRMRLTTITIIWLFTFLFVSSNAGAALITTSIDFDDLGTTPTEISSVSGGVLAYSEDGYTLSDDVNTGSAMFSYGTDVDDSDVAMARFYNLAETTLTNDDGFSFGIDSITISDRFNQPEMLDTTFTWTGVFEDGSTVSDSFTFENLIDDYIENHVLDFDDLYAGAYSDAGTFTSFSFYGMHGTNEINVVHDDGVVATNNQPQAQVPEPSSLALLSLGVLGFGASIRKRKIAI